MSDDEELIWFRTDTFIELRDSMAFVLEHLKKFPEDISSFRWSVFGSALALQGACVYQLYGHDTSGTAVLSERSRRKTMLHLNERSKDHFPTQRLADPMELLRRVSKPQETSNDFSTSWEKDDEDNCEHLINLRNEFVHFLPQGWSHCLVGYPTSLKSCWKIIRALLTFKLDYAHRVPADLHSDMLEICDAIDIELNRLEAEL